MRTPEELEEYYVDYVQRTVVELDAFFDSQIAEMKKAHPSSTYFVYAVSSALGKEGYRLCSSLSDTNIREAFASSCELFGWNVEMKYVHDHHQIIFRKKETDKPTEADKEKG